jgi:transcriptional regulator with XRE-family HTH domain
MAGAPRVGPSTVELNFTAPFGVVLRALRRAAGWTQLHLAVEVHRDHSYVSKWESGILRPDLDDVDRVAEALRLAAAERLLLHSAWMRSTNQLDPTSSTDELVVSLQAAATLRRLGQPRVAYELARRDSRAALGLARTSRPTDRKLRELLSVAAELFLEEVKAALDFVPRAQVRAGLLSANRREHRLVRDALDDRRAHLRFAVAEEAVLYNADRLDDAHRGAQELLGELGLTQVEWLAETIRAVAINSGLVGDPTALGQAWARFRQVEGDLPDSLQRFALEGFVRGFTPIAPDRAFQILGDADRALDNQPEPSGVRRVQLARAEGHLVVQVSGVIGDGDTRRRLEQALEISHRLDLSKYVIELGGLLESGSAP